MKRLEKRHSGRTIAFIGLIIFSLLLAACGSANNGGNTTTSTPGKGCTKIGVLLPETTTSPRWDGQDRPALTDGIKKAIPGAQVDYSNANGVADDQLTQAQSALSKGDCILVVAPVNGQQAVSIVQKAKDKNVPVIAYDRLIPSKDLNYYVSFDNIGVGQLQAQYIVDHYQDYVKGNNNNVVMINGGQEDYNAILFEKGAHETLQPLFDSKKLTLAYHSFTEGWDAAKAQNEMDAALSQTSGNVQIAYVANDTMAGTVIASLKAHNLDGKVLVTGQDASVQGIQNILLGTQMMTVYKNISQESSYTTQLVKALYDGTSTASLTNGHSIALPDPNSSVKIPAMFGTAKVVDKTNIIDTVLKDGVVTKADICKGVPAGTDGVC